MNYDASDLWKGECLLLKHHEKAMLVRHENEEAWVPYSQLHDDSELYQDSEQGEEGELVIPYWLARDKGWV